jgi:hypothetical protein
MYMNSAPHLLTQDRPEFERVLNEALRTAADTPGASGSTLSSDQLRAMALSAAAAISACAAAEYDHYLEVRRRQRAARNTIVYATAGGGTGDTTPGAGLFAIVAVLTPILAGTAALIFLLVGYLLTTLTSEPAIAAPLRIAGWLFAAIAITGILLGMVGLVVTALRDGSSAIHASNGDPDDVIAAKEAWLTALRDRGVLPFIAEAQTSSAGHAAGHTPIGIDTPVASHTPHSPHTPRPSQTPQTPYTPRLGYSRPGFSSRDSGAPDTGEGRPRFSSPDFSSPDFDGPGTKQS